VKFLLKQGADRLLLNKCSQSPLLYAIDTKDDLEIVQALLDVFPSGISSNVDNTGINWQDFTGKENLSSPLSLSL
jgi:hypothetical protein